VGALLGFLAFNALALALGLGVLAACRLVAPRPRALVQALGAGLVTGVATIGVATVVALVAGVELDAAVLAGVIVVAAAALGALALARGRRRAVPEQGVPWPSRAVWLPVGAFGLFITVQVITSWKLAIAWDAAHIWTLKALAISATGALDGQIFSAGSDLPSVHPDYPLLQPAVGALLFRFAGTTQHGMLIAELWTLLGAAVLAIPWLCRAGERTWLALVPLAVATAAATNQGIVRGDADMLMAGFLAVGGVCLARLLESSRRGYAVPAALCLAAAANTKNEGMVFALVLLVVAVAVAVAVSRRMCVLAVAGAAAALVLAVIPWRLWVSDHGPIPSDVTPLSKSLHPGFLADHVGQLDLGAQRLLEHFADLAYGWLIPAFLVVAVAALLSGRAARASAFYLAGVVGVVLALLWVYWTSLQPDVLGHIMRTSVRTVSGPLLLAAAGLAHLLPRLVSPSRAAGELLTVEEAPEAPEPRGAPLVAPNP